MSSRLLAYFQGVFYALTALWALADIDTFMMVTGPKTDVWLVKTVSWMILVVAIGLLLAARRRQVTAPIIAQGALAAASLAAVDIYYVYQDVIWSVYLIDAVVEVGILLAWIPHLIKPTIYRTHPRSDALA